MFCSLEFHSHYRSIYFWFFFMCTLRCSRIRQWTLPTNCYQRSILRPVFHTPWSTSRREYSLLGFRFYFIYVSHVFSRIRQWTLPDRDQRSILRPSIPHAMVKTSAWNRFFICAFFFTEEISLMDFFLFSQ